MNYRRIYADGYSYYLTLVTYRRNPLLIDNISLLREAFRASKKKYVYRIEGIVILPEHIHMIITPNNAMDYPKIIRYIKRYFVYGLDEDVKQRLKTMLGNSKYRRGHAGVWQERYYEHTIRNEKDFLEVMDYMKYNPLKHGLVDNIDDWEYSSFT